MHKKAVYVFPKFMSHLFPVQQNLTFLFRKADYILELFNYFYYV